jgi:4-carboxymuconolactone decarboxylase
MRRTATVVLALVCTTPLAAQVRPSVAPKAMQEIAPQLADYTDRVLFGDVWVRPELSPRDRSLVVLSVLIATGKTAQMGGHLGRGLSNGLKPSEISGMVTHLAFYTGWPNAVSALTVIEQVFTERKIDLAALRATIRSSPSGPIVKSTEHGEDFAPKFAQLTRDVIFADLWRRTDLNARDRSLVTIAVLAANGDEAQLPFYLQLSRELGLTRLQVTEALTHLAFYAGWPKANAAIRAASRVFGDQQASLQAAPRARLFAPGQDATAGPSANFTGSAVVASRFNGTGEARLGGATVTFERGARTNWHIHPLGQLLIVTAGRGWVQAEGEPVREVKPGDVVWTGPGVKHWHGATPASTMSHVAVAEALNGESVTWQEPVTDAQYALK